MSESMKVANIRLAQARAVLNALAPYALIPQGEGDENPTDDQLVFLLAFEIDRAERPYRTRRRRR